MFDAMPVDENLFVKSDRRAVFETLGEDPVLFSPDAERACRIECPNVAVDEQ